ncbi:hypothetical protein ENBRE01_0966 [Enteropsectra breve]|nr:hypothetical protein ENBRE01_0966 [Enteropsectra breve]
MQEQSIVFEWEGYEVDSNKNLYYSDASGKKLICKLKKHIYKMTDYEGHTYFIDNFGDCFVLNGEPVFITGTLGSPSYFAIRNSRIFIGDDYGRMWISALDGTIIHILFGKNEIKDWIAGESHSALVTEKENKKTILLFNSKYKKDEEISDVTEILETTKSHIDYIKNGIKGTIRLGDKSKSSV